MDTDVSNIFTKDLYTNEYFWLLLLGTSGLTLFFTESVLYSIVVGVLYLIGSLLAVFGKPLWERIDFHTDDVEADGIEDEPNKIHLGTLENKTPVYLDIQTLNHSFVIGMTRYGKTRLILALISEFIQKYSFDEVKLAFSDAKAVSFNVFGRSQHLFAPIAKNPEETDALIELCLAEMYKRLALFSDYHEKICTNIDEYYELSGNQLPRIVVIFDEVADSVEKDSVAEKNLTTLAKMGLAAGIHLILVTQRPTKLGISHEITSQCQTILCTYMKNATEYGSVAKIPSGVYNHMKPVQGLFMAFNPDLAPQFLKVYPDFEGWGFMKSRYIENHVIEGIAVVDSTENLDLPALESSIPSWQGSQQDKFDAIEMLEIKLGQVTVDDMKKYFGVSSRTGKNWLQMYNDNV